MPQKRIIREAFGPEQIEIAVKAYERALEFVVSSGDGDGDPNVKENIAVHIIAAGHDVPNFTFMELANRAISRYRVRRAMLMVSAAKTARERRI